MNERIKSFCFGHSDSTNKPTAIRLDSITSLGNTMKQSCKSCKIMIVFAAYFPLPASQAWCLGRFLPLLIGDLVPRNYEKWNVFLILLKIMEYAFAPVISEDQLDYLQMLTEDYLIQFIRHYPERKLVPKMHYLIHVASWVKRFVF